jgi:hypothetical protein
MPPYLMLAILNSSLPDWYFRLGSTNAHINHYQLYNLPAPPFTEDKADDSLVRRFTSALEQHEYEECFATIEPETIKSPFSQTVNVCLTALVERIVKIETIRGEIARTDRSELASDAQPLQGLIDRILFRLAGLTDAEASGLKERLAGML